MECLILLIVVVVVFVSVVSFFQGQARRSNLEDVARKFGGFVTPSRLSDTDLEMLIDGVPVHLRYYAGGKNSEPYTRLRFQTPLGGRLRVVPQGFWRSILKALGSEDIDLGDPRFDEAYVVQGGPPEWIANALDATARARIRRLAELSSGFLTAPSLTLEAGPFGLMVSVPRNLADERERLEVFVKEAVALFRSFRAPADEGITCVECKEVVAQGNCPICEHPLGASPRRCGACATPHHPECWTYFGGCSTYACKENP